MRIEPEISACSIVLVGHFNALIFSPLWFARNKLVSEAQADAANVSIIHPDVAILKLGKNQLRIERERFTAETTEAPWIDLCDFVMRTFGEFLVHTPINQMGINRSVHFSVGSEEKRNQIGRQLAPIEPWGDWGKEMDAAPLPIRAGSSNVTMLFPWSSGEVKGHLQATVQPSDIIKNGAGIFMTINDHYNSGPLERTVGCEHIMKRLNDSFETSIQKADRIIDRIMSLAD
jgi:hypothetical protein